jgi:hypothetical protein
MATRKTVRETINANFNQNKFTTNNFAYPSNIGERGMLMTFRKYSYIGSTSTPRGLNNADGASRADLRGSVFLPLPRNIDDNFGIRVDPFEQGAISSIVADTATSSLNQLNSLGFMDLINKIQGSISQTLPDPRSVINSIVGLNSNQTASLTNSIGPWASFLARNMTSTISPNVGRIIDTRLGTSTNQKFALHFDGVNLKMHNFNWSLSPESEQDSDTIRNIINLIKRNILPTYVDAPGGVDVLSRTLFNYPSVIDIFFVGMLNPSETYFVKYKSCLAQTFNVDYAPNQLAIMKGGRPAAVNIQLQVIETDIHTAEDYGVDVERQIFDRDPAALSGLGI